MSTILKLIRDQSGALADEPTHRDNMRLMERTHERVIKTETFGKWE